MVGTCNCTRAMSGVQKPDCILGTSLSSGYCFDDAFAHMIFSPRSIVNQSIDPGIRIPLPIWGRQRIMPFLRVIRSPFLWFPSFSPSPSQIGYAAVQRAQLLTHKTLNWKQNVVVQSRSFLWHLDGSLRVMLLHIRGLFQGFDRYITCAFAGPSFAATATLSSFLPSFLPSHLPSCFPTHYAYTTTTGWSCKMPMEMFMLDVILTWNISFSSN